ncbi:putative bifunctional diguanylate cyclase/phosphodiesterase [Amorphus orientalis]|uniref:Diguanylate cyclase (GGDEF)-like protein n=1 Tax=Amorphus orientalis TaxID=649198 RepID=A0AAE3VQC6_9HYPH|nr:EAL domain-containing protein [Amorphus orientalis]MDQ0316235.1 diguanylate cyclase (GGDEF)-like protein [Amorphus orientalis]
MFYEYSRAHEEYQLDEILSVLLVGSVGLIVAMLVMNRDYRREIARREAAESEAERIARRDPLTGLPNRRVFLEMFERQVFEARVSGSRLAVLLLDLDNFKSVNGVYGSDSADRVLQEVSQRISAVLGSAGFLARLTGDDFAILIEGADQPETLFRTARRILKEVSAPFDSEGLPTTVTGSIGIAVFPTDGETPAGILQKANVALGQAKVAGRNTYVLFDQALDRLLQNRKALEAALRDAIEGDGIVPNFQPIYNLTTMQPVAVEAYLRWDHPQKGLLGADEFLSIAEDAQLTDCLFFVLLDKVCTEMRRWPRSVSASLNVSSQQFADPDLAGKILAALEKNALPATALSIEVPEAAIVTEMKRTMNTLQQLHEAGVGIALDQFGTGFSSLRQLRDIPLDTVKIDSSFVKRVNTDVEARRVVSSIIDLGRALGFKTSASGIEQAAQAVWIRERGCELGQGNLFCEPLEADAMAALLAEAGGLGVR